MSFEPPAGTAVVESAAGPGLASAPAEVQLVACVVPLIVAAASLPMILGMVGPNLIYGFRTPKTLSDSAIWYPANRAAGWFTLVAAVVALAFNLSLWWSFPEWPPDAMMPWMVGGNLVPLAAALVASFRYIRRL